MIFPESTSVVEAPAAPLVSLRDAAARVGADPDSPPEGLQHELDQAHALVDGPNGRYGRCFRAWTLRARLIEWPEDDLVLLKGGSASAIEWNVDGSAARSGAARTEDGLGGWFVVPDQPDGWEDFESVLTINYTSGPEEDNVQTIAKGALLRLVSSLWADRIDPAGARLVAALEAADAVLLPFSGRLL